MTVLAAPNHPARLAGVFAASVVVFALLAAAAFAILYIIDNERGGAAETLPVNAQVDLPAGMVLVRQVANADAWATELGFAPILPRALQDDVEGPTYHVQQPDAAGRVAGHLRYTSADGGLLVVLVEQRGTLSADRPMRTGETATTREHIESFGCGTTVITAQLFFSLDTPGAPDAGESLAIADGVVRDLRSQCED